MRKKTLNDDKKLQAYIIGIALGDGNLSNPNGRAVRLRITCDHKYPFLITYIKKSLQELLPDNQISLINRKTCSDISCYSNYWPKILEWNAGNKFNQQVHIPNWIKSNNKYVKECLRGLFQTDGSIYNDRGYIMVNFVAYIPELANNVFDLIKNLGYKPNLQKRIENDKIKYTIRISRDSKKFINDINLWKK